MVRNPAHRPEHISFRAHSSHVGANNHAPFDCAVCHLKPLDVLSAGHMFDDSPERAEVAFRGALASGAVYDGNGGCSNVYCHGDGSGLPGAVQDDGKATECGSCHPDANSSAAEWNGMSGEHALHLLDGMVCSDCHASVSDGSQNIVSVEEHVDGDISHAFSETTIQMNGSTCTGICHSKIHFIRSW